MDIEYSDGEATERSIVSILESSTKLDSLTPIGLEHYASWPVRYHLCPERGHLLRPFDFSGLDVLELGAGMGGVSRSLAESARHLTVVEGTSLRLEALQARLRDLQNWEGHAANIQDVAFAKKFDAVVIVGVLEYAELFVTACGEEDPFTWFMRKAAGFLKDDGVLILAIENKMGLKYFNGLAEDHTGRLYDGVCGYSLARSPRTFARKELKSLFQQSGLQEVREFFPFPDYKIPRVLLTQQAMDEEPSLAADLASQCGFENYMQPTVANFPQRLAAHSIADGGLLADMSNSLLFVGAKKTGPTLEHVLARAGKGEIAWHYTGHGRKAMTCTAFSRKDNRVTVTKESLVGNPAFAGVETNTIVDEPWIHGEKLSTVLLRRLYFAQPDRFRATLESFLKWSVAKWAVAGKPEQLQGGAFDAILSNTVFIDDKTFGLFDLEWTWKKNVDVSWFILRNVYHLALDADFRRTGLGVSTPARLYTELCEKQGVEADLVEDVKKEAAAQALLSWNESASAHEKALMELMHLPCEQDSFAHLPGEKDASVVGKAKAVVKRTLSKYPGVYDSMRKAYRGLWASEAGA